MKLLRVSSVLLAAVATVVGQTIDLGTPTNGTVLSPGQNFTSQVILPESLTSCIRVGIALSIVSCDNGPCPPPTEELGYVFYAGPWNPTPHIPGGFYQNFSLQVPQYMTIGPASFTLTHLCLLGADPYPLLEFRNAFLTIE